MDQVLTRQHAHLSALDDTVAELPVLGALVSSVPRLSATTSLAAVDRLLARQPEVSCVAVDHPTVAGLVGLLDRARCAALMTGPFGYGRSLHARRDVAEVAQWDALVLPAHTEVVEAASRAITRDAEHAQDPVLVPDPDGPGFAAVAMPVLLAALAKALARHALTDPLTGLANRAAFFGRVEESVRRSATRAGHRTVVLYSDLDGFKRINDLLGHEAGDDVLRRTAVALRSAARPGDLVARLGGDEFAVCIDVETTGGQHADSVAAVAAVADRVHDALTEASREQVLPVRVSTGVAVGVPGAAVEAAELVRAADLAMYTGKRAGGDRVSAPVVVAGPASVDPLMGTSFAAAADADEFFLLYQPIVDLRTGEVASYEALVRWRHPRLGMLTPDAFLPALQRSGDMADLDDWVLTRACTEFAALFGADAGPRPYLNVNTSSDRLLAPGLTAALQAAAAGSGLDVTRVRLEVPEHLLVEQLDAAAGQLGELRAAGVPVTLDDVGAGETSLRHLREVHADGIKIDRSYIQGIATDDRDRALVRMLVDFADSTGAKVTAEGVETADQAEVLRELGCGFAQGWLFGRPAPLPG